MMRFVASIGLLGLAACPAPDRSVTIERVIDGDTVVTSVGTVRLIGIDTPETVAPGRPVECGGREATVKLASYLPKGAQVNLVPDLSQPERDRYGRILAYLDRPGTGDVGLLLLQDGLARTLKVGAEPQRWGTYRAAEREAQGAPRGIWKDCR